MKFDADAEQTRYISKVVGISHLNFLRVDGFALVTQLDSTGADPPRMGVREEIIKDMQAHNVRNANEILRSQNTSIAHIRGYLPPGIRKGERFDLTAVMVSECGTSLRGGFAMQFDLRPISQSGAGYKSGHIIASGKGRILVDAMFADNQDVKLEQRGVILAGGVALEDRELGLALQDEYVSLATIKSISRAINQRFSTYRDGVKVGVADPKNDHRITLLVPEPYRRNVGRFVQVVMNTAYSETLEQQMNRLEKLEIDLSNPELAEVAAVRLESIGKNAIPILRRGLRDPNREVRFHAAQALTYLDESDGIEELKKAALEQPDFRWHALTALASSGELDAGAALADLIHVESVETRYGAFHALKIRSPNDPLVVPDPVSKEFFLNIVPTTATSVVHFARQHRPEIVVFGGGEPLESNLLYVERGLTIRVDDQAMIEITRFDSKNGEVKVTCPNSTAALLRTLTQIGCDYETIFDLCVDAKRSRTFNARVEVDRLPSSLRARNRDEDALAMDEEEEEEREPKSLPTMFSGPARETEPEPPDEVNTSDTKPKNFFDRMKSAMRSE